MKVTRKNYLELFLDGSPAIAPGRASNRHTSLVEAIEHAEEHASSIGETGTYEVRIDGGLYYTVKITNLVLDAELDPSSPPLAQAQFYINENSVSGDENTVISFSIVRNIRNDQVCDIDWAITNATVTPTSGTQRFQIGESVLQVNVTAGSIDTDELGEITISNPVLISGPAGAPILAQPSSIPIRVFDTDQESFTEPSPGQDTYFSGENIVADVGWQTDTARIVDGFYYGVHPSHTVPFSGIFQSSTLTLPSYFHGRRLRRVNIRWRDLEPNEGNWNFSTMDDAFNNLDARFDGIHLNVRGNAHEVYNNSGDFVDAQVTRPAWMLNKSSSQGPGTVEDTLIDEGWNGTPGASRRVINIDLREQAHIDGWLALIQEITDRGYASSPLLHNQLLHGVSSSLGEEWTGEQADNTPGVEAAYEQVIDAWVNVYASVGAEHKLMWLKAEPSNYFNRTVNNGAGNRAGGSMESYLRFQYTPGIPVEQGMLATEDTSVSPPDLYIEPDPDFVICQRTNGYNMRAWQEQNEAGYGAAEDQFHYRMATFRGMQMRFDNMFVPNESDMYDPRCTDWASMQYGQQPDDPSAEAICVFCSLNHRGGGQLNTADRTLHNVEKWLRQRETEGNPTTPTKLRNYVQEIGSFSNMQLLPRGHFARRGTYIPLSIDPAFISLGTSQAVWIMVTYDDTGTAPFTIEWDKGTGIGSGQITRTKTDTGRTQTAIVFAPSFRKLASGYNPDIALSGNGNTDYYMVRVVKDH